MSAQLNQLVLTRFQAHGGNVSAVMGGMARSTGAFTNQVSQASRMSTVLNNQWKAIGTTIRYAMAGGLIFGARNVFSQFKDIQRQLGLISAIGEFQGPGGRGVAATGDRLQALAGRLRNLAVETRTPINEMNDAAINFLSTVQKVPEDQLTPMLRVIAEGAQLAQVSSEDATKAFTTMNIAFGRSVNLKNVQRMANEFFILTKQAPGGVAAGQQIIGQLGLLAQTTRAAHGTPQDMFSLLLSTLRAGIPPAQSARGLQFMLQTVGLPGSQTKASREAMASIGILPGSPMSAQERITRIMRHARELGVKGHLTQAGRNMEEDTLMGLEELPPGQAAQRLGVSGPGGEFLATVFRRIHALRTALAISGQIDTGQAQKDFKLLTDAERGHIQDINRLSKAWQNFANQTKLQEATIAIQAMQQQVIQSFAPVFKFVARGTTGFQHLMSRHEDATRRIAIGSAIGLGALGLARFTRLGNLPGIRRLPGARSILGANLAGLATANAVQAMATGGSGQLGSSPQNPIYAVIVYDLYRGATGRGINEPPTPPRDEPPLVPVGRFARARAIARRAARLGAKGALIAGPRVALGSAEGLAVGAAFVAPIVVTNRAAGGGESRIMHPSRPLSPDEMRRAERRFPDIKNFVQGTYAADRPLSKRYQALLQQFMQGQMPPEQVHQRLQRLQRRDAGEKTRRVVIEQMDPKTGAKVKRTVKLPAAMWRNGTVPVVRGRPGK